MERAGQATWTVAPQGLAARESGDERVQFSYCFRIRNIERCLGFARHDISEALVSLRRGLKRGLVFQFFPLGIRWYFDRALFRHERDLIVSIFVGRAVKDGADARAYRHVISSP